MSNAVLADAMAIINTLPADQQIPCVLAIIDGKGPEVYEDAAIAPWLEANGTAVAAWSP